MPLHCLTNNTLAPLPGRHQIWRYLITLLLIFIVYIIGFIILLIYAAFTDLYMTQKGRINPLDLGISPYFFLLLFTLPFLFSLLALIIGIKWIHRSRLFAFINRNSNINYIIIIQTAIGWFLFLTLIHLLLWLLNAAEYQYIGFSYQWLWLLITALVISWIPITFEEIFYRSYLLYALSCRTGILTAVVITTLIFGLSYWYNPATEIYDWAIMMLYYTGLGAAMAYLALKYNGIEACLGIRWAQQLHSIVFIHSSNAVFNTGGIIQQKILSPAVFIFITFIGMITFIYLYNTYTNSKT